MINRKFLYFNTLAGFKAALIDKGDDRTGIRQDSIVFIGQEKLIWNRGVFYGKDEHKDERSKGLFQSEEQLIQTVPSPSIGDWAFVKVNGKYYIYLCEIDNIWVNSGNEYQMGMSQDEIELMFNWYTQDQQSIISNIQDNLQNIDGKYQDAIEDINSILQGLPKQFITPDNILDYIPHDGNQENVITTDNIHDYIPENIITNTTIAQYIPENIITADNILDYVPPQVVTTVDQQLQQDSTNPVQNAAIYAALDNKADKSQLNKYATNDQLQDVQEILQTKASSQSFEDYLSSLQDLSSTVSTKANSSDLASLQASQQQHAQYSESTYAKKGEVEQNVNNYVTQIIQSVEKAKGYFDTEQELNNAVPNPEVGDWAIVNVNDQWVIFRCATAGTWQSTGQNYTDDPIDLSLYAKKEELSSLATKAELLAQQQAADNKYLTQEDIEGLGTGNVKQEDLLLYVKKETYDAHTDYAELTYAKKSQLNDVVRSVDIQNFITSSALQGLATEKYVDDNIDVLDDKIESVIQSSNNQNFAQSLITLQERVQYLYDKYISWLLQGDEEPGGDTPVPDIPVTPIANNNMITLTESAYQALVEAGEVNPNTYYFTYVEEEQEEPSSDTTWHFGDAFPIIFNDKWEFGDNFPIILTEQWTFGGTFPIKLK